MIILDYVFGFLVSSFITLLNNQATFIILDDIGKILKIGGTKLSVERLVTQGVSICSLSLQFYPYHYRCIL